MSKIIRFKDFNPSLVTFSKIRVLGHGGKASYPQYNGKRGKLYVQTPKNLKIPFGINLYEGTSGPKYSIELSFTNYNIVGEEINMFYNKLLELDKIIFKNGF